MAGINVRINVLGTAALDGVTTIPPATQIVLNSDGYYEVNIPPALTFGLFDPGQLPKPLSGIGGNYVIQHLEIVQDPAVPLGAGDLVEIVGPGLGGAIAPATGFRRTLIDFGDFFGGDARTSGALTEGLCTPFPIDHLIAFTTAAGNGPYAIMLTYTPAEPLLQTCQPPTAGIGGGPPGLRDARGLASDLETRADLSEMNAGEAIEAVESEGNVHVLAAWASEESRVTVTRAIESRLEELED